MCQCMAQVDLFCSRHESVHVAKATPTRKPLVTAMPAEQDYKKFNTFLGGAFRAKSSPDKRNLKCRTAIGH